MIDLTTAAEAVNSTGTFIDAVTNFLPKIVAISAAISAIMPKPQQPGLLSALHGLVNFIGLNIGHARNSNGR